MDISTTHTLHLEDTETFRVTGHTTGLLPVTVRAKTINHRVGSSRITVEGQRLLADGKRWSMDWRKCIVEVRSRSELAQFPPEVLKALQLPEEGSDG